MLMVPVCALLIGILLQAVLARLLSSKAKGWLALAFGLASFAGVLALYPEVSHGRTIDIVLARWDGPLSLAYRIDGLSQMFALMATAIGAAVLLYSIGYMAHDPGATRFYILMQAFIAGLIHLVYSADLFLMYLSWEIIGLCSFFLVGFWYKQKDAAAGARKVLVMTHIAGYGLLAAILIIFARTGATLWTDPKAAAAFNTGIFLLIALAAAAKSVQFPIHTWIPDAMAAPIPVSALLHAACYVKAGVYLIARLHSVGPWPVSWQELIIWLGTATLLVGGLFAMVQTDLKRLLAFSTVSQIGYMMLALGLSTPLGIAAGLLHCLNHGFFKGSLFLCAGAVQHASGTRDMDMLGGLGRRMPRTTISWLIGAGAISGVPLFSGFVSKWLIYNAALEAGFILPALISWIVSVITVFYFLKATTGVFFGEESEKAAVAHEAPSTMTTGALVLTAVTVLLGVAPQIAVRWVINPLLPALGAEPVIGVSWFGLTAGTGSWYSTAGLILVLLAVGAGAAFYLLARPRRPKEMVATSPSSGCTFTGGEPLAGPGRMSASDFSLIVKNGLAPFYKWMDPDRYYLFFWRILLAISGTLENAGRRLEKQAIPVMVFLAVLLSVVLLVFVPARKILSMEAPSVPLWPIAAGLALSFLAILLASSTSPEKKARLPLIFFCGLIAILGLGMDHALARVLILELSAVIALVLIWKADLTRLAGRVYLVAVLLSAVALVGGTVLLDTGRSSPLMVPFILMGFALKLALVPLYLWLPRVAERVPAAVIGLVVSVVDIAAFVELLIIKGEAPVLFDPEWPWLAVAMISAFGGAVLMLAQKELKRLLAFSTIEDMGYLLLAVIVGGKLGLTGAVLGAVAHSLAKALMFSSLTGPEIAGESLELGKGGTCSRHPAAGVGFVFGALAMLGVPPTVGYAARWRIYSAALEAGPVFMAVLMVSTALALLAYARVVALYWWGPGDGTERKESRSIVAVVVIISFLLLALGLYPGLMTG